MYCRHCGKEIAEDSKYCQHCGGSQEETTTSSSTEVKTASPQKGKIVEIPTIKTNFSESTKWWICGYSLWIVLNLYWLFAGVKSEWASSYFQPISGKMGSNESYYDISEFIVYVLGLPLIIWGIIMLEKKRRDSEAVNDNRKQVAKNEDNTNIDDTLGL